MSRSKSTTFSDLTKGYYDRLPGQGPDVPYPATPAFSPAPEKPVIQKLYTVKELSKYLRIGERPIYAAIKAGRLTSSFIGRSHLIAEDSIISYVTRQQGVTSWHGKKANAETK